MKNRIVVTGAAGFLGGRTVKFLAEHYSNYQIIATSRRNHRASEFDAYQCEFIAGDLLMPDFCEKLTQNTDIVVHCAALSAPFGKYSSFYQSNYFATKTLLDTSIKNGVKKFIFISTPSVYFNFKDRFNIKESDLLPTTIVNHYAATKLMAETYVLNANDKGIQTIALRPRAIIGAEDTVIFPRILEAYKKNKLKIVGNGKNSCDFTCVRNVIEAIICAIDAPPSSYGQAYNITDGNPVLFWETLNYALTALNLIPPSKKVPFSIALCAAGIIEMNSKFFLNHKEPSLTKYGVGILAKSMTLDISKAKENLNYSPVMKTYEGINEYIKWKLTQN
jgi:nucleoside-diphosphate-sugar epimerase